MTGQTQTAHPIPADMSMNGFAKIIIITALMAGVPLTDVGAADTLTVDLTHTIRPATHCASGSLYGLTETLPADINEMVAPLKPNVFCQAASALSSNQHDFGDGFVVAERLRGTTGSVQFLLADLLPNWPYQWPGQKKWLELVEAVLKRHEETNLSNIDSYVIWNEANETWQESNGDFLKDLWEPTYRLIRRYQPNTKIVGPATSFYSRGYFEPFLTFCKENDCMPDLICWHQWGSGGFVAAVEDLHKLEKELEIPDLPLCINEYSASSDYEMRKYEGCPGYCVPFISKFERNNVESATISWWFTHLAGRLGSLLTESNERGGGWWLYKWYGEMEGDMTMVTPPNDKSDGLDGFACVNKYWHTASVVLGGNYVGDVDVVFPQLPQWLQGKARIKIERVTWEDKDIPVDGTDLIDQYETTLTGKPFTQSVKVESELYAYRITLTAIDVPRNPYKNTIATVPGIIEAENFDESGQAISYYDTDDKNNGGEYRDECVDIVTTDGGGYAIGYTQKGEWVEYTIQVEETGDYVITARVSDAWELDGFHLYVDGKEITEAYTIPATCDDWSQYEEIGVSTAHLTQGKHILKLQIEGSYVNIDWLKFEPDQQTKITEVLAFAERFTLKGTQFYDLQGNKIATERLQPNTLYIAVQAGQSKLILLKQ